MEGVVIVGVIFFFFLFQCWTVFEFISFALIFANCFIWSFTVTATNSASKFKLQYLLTLAIKIHGSNLKLFKWFSGSKFN